MVSVCSPPGRKTVVGACQLTYSCHSPALPVIGTVWFDPASIDTVDANIDDTAVRRPIRRARRAKGDAIPAALRDRDGKGEPLEAVQPADDDSPVVVPEVDICARPHLSVTPIPQRPVVVTAATLEGSFPAALPASRETT